jgi:hypothetical protein
MDGAGRLDVAARIDSGRSSNGGAGRCDGEAKTERLLGAPDDASSPFD